MASTSKSKTPAASGAGEDATPAAKPRKAPAKASAAKTDGAETPPPAAKPKTAAKPRATTKPRTAAKPAAAPEAKAPDAAQAPAAKPRAAAKPAPASRSAAAAKPRAARRPGPGRKPASPSPSPASAAKPASSIPTGWKLGALGAFVAGAGAALAVGLRRFLLPGRPDEGHVPTDLLGDRHPGPDDRAPVDFRPDPTAPVSDADREALRPPPGVKP